MQQNKYELWGFFCKTISKEVCITFSSRILHCNVAFTTAALHTISSSVTFNELFPGLRCFS